VDDGPGEAPTQTDSGQPGSTQAAGLLRVRRFPELTVATPRLNVRGLVEQDADAVAGLFAERQAQRWLALPAGCADRPEALAWCTELAQERRDSGGGDHYAVVRREDDGLVGCMWTKRTDWAALATEVCFAVCVPARGFGFAGEALDALSVALILEHGFQRVELRIAPGNTAARRVGEKAGFVYEGLLRNAGYLHSGRVDLELWSLVAADLR
jgi:[ribosomal protein S5]-alanine N-acetyltransferase